MADNNQTGVCSTLCDCVCSVTEDGKCAALRELRAEVERLRDDAKRYRWLRSFMNLAIVNKALVKHDTLDAAIDAAMREGE